MNEMHNLDFGSRMAAEVFLAPNFMLFWAGINDIYLIFGQKFGQKEAFKTG